MSDRLLNTVFCETECSATLADFRLALKTRMHFPPILMVFSRPGISCHMVLLRCLSRVRRDEDRKLDFVVAVK